MGLKSHCTQRVCNLHNLHCNCQRTGSLTVEMHHCKTIQLTGFPSTHLYIRPQRTEPYSHQRDFPTGSQTVATAESPGGLAEPPPSPPTSGSGELKVKRTICISKRLSRVKLMLWSRDLTFENPCFSPVVFKPGPHWTHRGRFKNKQNHKCLNLPSSPF